MTLGKYRLIAELGRGGMADVFLAVRSESAAYFTKLVVIKKPKEHLANDVEFMTMLIDEARITARLNHPNLVQTLEVGEANGEHFLTMEYLDGQPLHRILARARSIPREMYLSILIDVLAGIHYAHELTDFDGSPLRIVHRDVTPHNCFVTYQGQVKVVDFGIAKAVGRAGETRHGVIKGKVTYMAPEQACGQVVDRRADVFAVGVMLFEAATGRRMWKGVSETEVIRNLVNGNIPSSIRAIDPNLDEELERIVRSALAHDPDQRYPTAAALQQDLETYMNSKGPRPSATEMGKFVSQLFADKRATTDAIIKSQLARVMTEPSAAIMQLPISAVTASEEISVRRDELPSADPVDWSTSESDHGGVDDNAETEIVHKRGSRWMVAALAALCIVITLATVAVIGLRLKRTAWTTSSTEPVESITVTLRATPLETRFFIDDGPPLANPYVGTFPRDGREHRIRATAPGYRPKNETLIFEEDHSMRFTLAANPPNSSN